MRLSELPDDEALLAEYAVENDDHSWEIGTTRNSHCYTRESAVALIKACLLLDMEVTTLASPMAWYDVVRSVRALEERLDRAGL